MDISEKKTLLEKWSVEKFLKFWKSYWRWSEGIWAGNSWKKIHVEHAVGMYEGISSRSPSRYRRRYSWMNLCWNIWRNPREMFEGIPGGICWRNSLEISWNSFRKFSSDASQISAKSIFLQNYSWIYSLTISSFFSLKWLPLFVYKFVFFC